MQFDSFSFLIFFACVLLGYNALPGWNSRKNFLLAASYVFYAAWNPPFLLLLIGSTTLDWWIARRIARSPGIARRSWVVATLLVNLLVLGYFKYSVFLLDTFASALLAIGATYHPPPLDIVLPIGISFYTFHSLSYCIDVYRGKFEPTPSWRDYALYVGFFPQLVAGPIVRYTQMREQIETPRRSSVEGVGMGLALLILGLFEKIVLADSVFAPVADGVFNAVTAATTVSAWLGMIAFSGQIFCDFAGYSTCALGAALALGFELPVNFRNPYAAVGFSDFWQRWHISLSSWLRDYLYVSLGGNRRGTLLTYRNLLLTMLIGGLWHGAAWTFVAWGGLHGLYLVLERLLRKSRGIGDASPRGYVTTALYWGVTLLGVMYAWIWFRARTFADGWSISRHLIALPQWSGAAENVFDGALALGVFLLLLTVQLCLRNTGPREFFTRLPALALGAVLGVMLTLTLLSPGDNHAFIYFQF
ncbi:MAG: MBOAT family protein [Tahibacter sp.]